ncbi:MAG: hypothetical protein HW421_2546 [Ignavibacteria bacterium]|nr:hypothetical protein [Ignavibacteria bacterium]
MKISDFKRRFFTSFRMTSFLFLYFISFLGLAILKFSGFIIITILLLVLQPKDLQSSPEYAILTGNRCSNCHINLQGGGARTIFGATFGRDASMLSVNTLGIDSLYQYLNKREYHTPLGSFAFGTDFRYQSFRSHKTEQAVRKYLPMQASLYASDSIFSWLTAEGNYNFGPKVFAGQQIWSASAILKPSKELPSLRLGYFQPSIGYRKCDMTSLDRRTAYSNGSQVLIAPNFAEYGAEITYEGLPWLTANAGIFNARSLAEVSAVADTLIEFRDNPSFTLRFVLYPKHFYEELPDFLFGSSVLVNGDFWLSDIFTVVGITDEIFINASVVYSSKEYVRKTRNFLTGITYMPCKGVFISLNAERGNTDLIFYPESPFTLTTDMLTLSARIYLLPNIELLPEYRYVKTFEYESTRWAFQFHFYY